MKSSIIGCALACLAILGCSDSPTSPGPDSGTSGDTGTSPGDTGAPIDGTVPTDSSVTADSGVTCDLPAPCDAPTGYQCWFVSADAAGTGTGTVEDPFGTIQQAIDAMSGGDFVYLRGGTYPEVVAIPLGKDGTCTDTACADGSWSTIRSYPGEWAVLDGGHTGYTIGRSTNGSGSGTLPDGTWGGLQDIHYWKLEYLEITGGGAASGGGGFVASGGPFVLRYLYVHDNVSDSRDGNPAGLRGYTWHESLVEHCYFRNNGCTENDGNCADIAVFSDYAASRHPDWDWMAGGPHTITYATRLNEYRHNLFEGSPSGIKHKNDQTLAARTGTDWRYEEMGDDIHHNIFLDEVRPISAVQDFAQVHHNIMRGGSLHLSTSHAVPEMIHIAAYNNLIIEGNLQMYIPYYDPNIIVDFHPYVYMANNIVEGFEKKWDSPSIAVGVGMDMEDSGMATVDLSDALLDRNYIYNPVDPEHFRVGRHAGACSDWLSTDAANACYATENYAASLDASDPLHPDDTEAGRFKTRSAHALGAGATIGNGGHGAAHPHLDGVTLPAHVGPCEDDACVWVDEVLRLRTLGADYRPAGCE